MVIKEQEIDEQLEELDELEEEVQAEIAKMQPGRDEMAKKIPQDAMSFYTRLLDRGKGNPIVPVLVHNGCCGNCHLKLPPQTINETRKSIVVLCDNCSHLLYFPES